MTTSEDLPDLVGNCLQLEDDQAILDAEVADS